MRFQVTRTSGRWGSEKAPCPGATIQTVPTWDYRTFKSPADYDAQIPNENWHDRGTEHGFWGKDGEHGIKRRLGDHQVWMIELDDLEALCAFADHHGELVFMPARDQDDWLKLEIYDDYRE